MVVFNELEMEGFKRYDSPKKYTFNEGLIGIFGKNESGKSTIGDAISVALFGLSSTSYKKADIVTWGKSNAKIRVDFETDIPYRVERTLGKKSRAVLKRNNTGRWEIIANTIKSVDAQIQDILGLDYKSFKNSIFIGQNELNSLSSLNKNERQTIINRLSRYDELSKAEDIIKNDLKEKRINLQILEKDFKSLDTIVKEKKEKNKRLTVLKESYSKKNRVLEEENDKLEKTSHEIQIFGELKKINEFNEKINGIENQITEKVDEISRIEGKESDKSKYQEKLKKLEHLNKDLEETVEEIKRIVKEVGELETLQTEVNKLESLITEKNKEISRIEGKELDKSEYQEKLKKLEHVNQSLKDNVEDIENAHSKIKQNNNNKDNALNEIKGFEKNLKGLKASIKEKNTEVQRIEKKECEIKKLEDELNKFDHHNLQLKTLIDNISNTLSELTHLNREIDRINREKSEIGHLKDEKELKTHYDAYEEISSLEEKTNRIVDSVKSLDNDISLKKEQLGNLKDEKGDLGDIEKKYESGKSKATLFIVSGIFISLLGAALGFLINLFLITLMFIGIIPLYKGYKDRNFFKTKLDDIKEKREFFGQLKQLEIQKKEKEDEHNSYLKKLDNYKKLDRKTLEKDHKTYKNLENQIKTLKNLDNNKIDVEKRIKDFKEDLSNFYEKLPDHYKQDVPITDLEIDKKLTTIYQDEDKQKNSLKTSINELYKEIPRKSEIIEGKDKLEIKKQEIETQINKKEGNINEILKSEKKLGLKLKNLFERLPTHYKEEASIDDENMDKIISKIYQEEDREKNKYLTAIEGLDEEISRKDEVIKDKVGLESQKTKVENQIKDENQRLTKELEGYYNNLPTHYKEEASIDDENMDKIISKIYQKEDREKNKYLTAIEGLDEEISRKDEVIKDKVGLESQKTKVENQIKDKNQRLTKELEGYYNNLPTHYKEEASIDDENMDKIISKIYQKEDKEKSKFETSINELNKEISRKPQIIKDKEALETEKEGFKNNIRKLETGLIELTDEEDLAYDPYKHKQLEIQEKKLDQRIKQCERDLGKLQGGIKTLEKDTVDLDKKIEELNGLIERIDKFNFDFDVMDIARNEIANTAKMLREQVMERTRKHVYFLLPRITTNKYRDVKITEDFKIKVYSPEKNEFESMNSLSGGAKDQILFALRLAFTNAIVGGRSRSKGFALFLDEFLGSFDQSRRDETLEMLRDLKEDFRQIFLISHIDGMEGNVDQIIRTPEI